jgi:hypothetical protein
MSKATDSGGTRGSGSGWMVLLVILAIVGALVLIPALAAIVGVVLHLIVGIIAGIIAAIAGLIGVGAIALVFFLPILLLLAIGFAIGRARRKS